MTNERERLVAEVEQAIAETKAVTTEVPKTTEEAIAQQIASVVGRVTEETKKQCREAITALQHYERVLSEHQETLNVLVGQHVAFSSNLMKVANYMKEAAEEMAKRMEGDK